jgi:hypothetical protein
LRYLHRAGLFEIRTIQGLVAILSVKEHVIIGAFCDGASALAELGFVKACRSALAKVF